MLNTAFAYRHAQLHCEDVALEEIVERAGTPIYVYSAGRIRHNVRQLQTAFADFDVQMHYSLKANANLSIIRLLYSLGLGMDAVSGGEIFKALQAGVPAEQIVFAGVGKTADELRYALEQGVGWFNVESLGELELLNNLAADAFNKPHVALRMNPAVQAQTHRHIATGHGKAKFGISLERVRQILEKAARYDKLNIVGVHLHIGSQLESVQPTVDAVGIAQDLLAAFPAIKTLNIGGGLPIRTDETHQPPTPDEFARALKPVLSGWQIKLEPGRSIIADAGALLMDTLYIKDQGATRFAITDGSMTELIRPALYEAEHPIYPLQEAKDEMTWAIAGPVCETADILRSEIRLPALKTGDKLAVLLAGAYGYVMASNYNQRPRPAEVLVEGDTWRIIRQRETWDDLLRGEI